MREIKKSALSVLLLVISFCLLGLQDASAAIYKYIDKDGLVTFANDLQAVPPEFRAQAVIVTGERKEEDVKPPDVQTLPADGTMHNAAPAPVQPQVPGPAESAGRRSFGSRALVSAIVVVTAVFAFVILGIIDADHKKIIRITRVVIIWLVSVFLLYSHAGDAVRLFRSIGSNVDDAHRESGEKGKKAAEAMKALNAVVEHVEQSSTEAPPTESQKKD